MNRYLMGMNMWSDFEKVSRNMILAEKGCLFEIVSRLIFEQHDELKDKVKNVWYRSEVPEEIRKKHGLYIRDVGIDMIIETKKDIYAVQCKYKSKTRSKIYETDIVTFREELKRTGIRGILISNTESYEKTIEEDENIITMGEYFTDEKLDNIFFEKIHEDCKLREIYDSNTTEWMLNLDKIDKIINSNEIYSYDEKKKLQVLNKWYRSQVWKMMRTMDGTLNKTIVVRPNIHDYWVKFCKKNYKIVYNRNYSDILNIELCKKPSGLLKHSGYIGLLYKPEQ